MNRKQFIFVLLALLIIGAAGLMLFRQQKESWDVRENKVGEKVFANFPVNDIAAIHIAAGSDLNIERKDGVWQVRERNGYPASYNSLRDFLIKVKDLKIVQSEMVGPSQLNRVNLAPPDSGEGAGTLLELKDAQGKVIDSLLAGKLHARHNDGSRPMGLGGLFDGRYILLPSDPKSVLLISDELSGVGSRPEPWLNHDFVKIENLQSVSLASPEGGNQWTLSRENPSAPWTLDNNSGQPPEPHITTQITEGLNFLAFEDVTKDVDLLKAGLAKPTVINATTFDKFIYTFKIGNKRDDGNYFVTVTVTAEIPAEQSEQNKALREKLAREQKLAPWTFLIDENRIERIAASRQKLTTPLNTAAPAN